MTARLLNRSAILNDHRAQPFPQVDAFNIQFDGTSCPVAYVEAIVNLVAVLIGHRIAVAADRPVIPEIIKLLLS